MKTCNRCGECCRHINFGRVAQLRPDAKEYLLALGCIIDQGFMLLPYTCPHLEYEFAACAIPGDEKEAEKDIRCLCNIHEHKPKICQQFNGKRFFNHQLYYVPKGCALAEHEVKKDEIV